MIDSTTPRTRMRPRTITPGSHTAHTPPWDQSSRARIALAAAALSFAAALIHASVLAAHAREWWAAGVFFALVTPLQLAWAEGVRRRRDADRRLLLAGVAGNLAVAAVWVLSRTAGLPVGPEAFTPEPVGVKDLAATADELALAALAGVLLVRTARSAAPARALPTAWTLAVVSGLMAALGGH